MTRSSTGSPSQSSESWSSSSRQIVLPFPGLNGLYAVAVDGAGDVYVADSQNHRVLELAAGASTQTELPFTGLSFLNGVAVDGAGDVYVTDYGKNRVLKLPPAYVFSFYHSWCRFSPTPCIVAPQSVSSAPLSANRVAIYPCFLGLVATGILGALGAAEPSSPNHSYRIDLDP